MKNALYAATALAFLAAPASATLQLSANIGGNIVSCADQAACDTNAAIGQLEIANLTIAGVQFLGSAQTQQIGLTNSLNTSSFQVINNSGASINILFAVSGTNYQGPVSVFNSSSSGTFQSAIGSTAGFGYYADTANGQGADNPTDLPGVLLASDVKSVTIATDAFAFNHAGAFSDPNLYSMSLSTTATLTNGGSLVGRSQAIVTTQDVPEPASLAVLGMGLIGLGMVRRSPFRRT